MTKKPFRKYFTITKVDSALKAYIVFVAHPKNVQCDLNQNVNTHRHIKIYIAPCSQCETHKLRHVCAEKEAVIRSAIKWMKIHHLFGCVQMLMVHGVFSCVCVFFLPFPFCYCCCCCATILCNFRCIVLRKLFLCSDRCNGFCSFIR